MVIKKRQPKKICKYETEVVKNTQEGDANLVNSQIDCANVDETSSTGSLTEEMSETSSDLTTDETTSTEVASQETITSETVDEEIRETEEMCETSSDVTTDKTTSTEEASQETNTSETADQELKETEEFARYDTKGVSFSKVQARTRGSRKGNTEGVLSIVNSKKNGKRIGLGKKVIEWLGDPEGVNIGYGDNHLVIATGLMDGTSYKVRKDKKNLIYNSVLVEEITDKYGLDFANRTSLTFYDADYAKNADDHPVVVIHIN